jgi:hypothetical protein
MSYVLREQIENRYYCKEGTKIIEFNKVEDAYNFLNSFGAYCTMRAMSEDISLLGIIHQVLNATIVEEKPENCECEFINYENLK